MKVSFNALMVGCIVEMKSIKDVTYEHDVNRLFRLGVTYKVDVSVCFHDIRYLERCAH